VFLQESLGDLVSLDGTVARSFATLVRAPGQLTVDYLAGRRTGFLSPMRVFIDAGVAASIATWLIPETWPLFGVGPELFGEGTGLYDLLAAAAWIPLGVAAHWLALRRTRPMLMEHGVFVLHVVAFSFLLAPLEGLLYLLTPTSPIVATIVTLFAPVAWGTYWWAALAKFVGKSMRSALADVLRVYGATVILLVPVFLYLLLPG